MDDLTELPNDPREPWLCEECGAGGYVGEPLMCSRHECSLRPLATARAVIGDARDAILSRLDILFDAATKEPWRPYGNGVHPVDVGGMGSGQDFAICEGFGPNFGNNCQWIAAIHNDWPMIRQLITELAAATGRSRA